MAEPRTAPTTSPPSAPSPATATAPPAARRRALRHWLPPQHGAWAMLLLPFGVGVECSRPVWLHLPLLVAWLTGYPLSYYALLGVKTGRPQRFAAQVRGYGTVCLAAAAVVAAGVPAVCWFAPAFAVLLGVNAAFARRHDDRALTAGLASAASSSLMVPLAEMVAGRPAADGVLPGLLVLAYLTGSVLFVRTVIRRRDDRPFQLASVVVHAALTAAAGLVAWPLAALFGWFTVRAAWVPSLRPTPLQTGMLELVNIVAVLVTVPFLAGRP